MFDAPHRRLNPLTGDWVLVSPQRTGRPWLGQVEKMPPENLPPYDPGCYLCPGNARAGGAQNPEYTGTFVFDNDFAALKPDAPAQVTARGEPLLQAQPETGICRVVCLSPRQVFENKGAMMGASNPHPHSQIWSQSRLPNELEKELRMQRAYAAAHAQPLLIDVLRAETRQGERLVAENEHFAALVPFWAIWPFETLVVAKRPMGCLTDLTSDEVRALAQILQEITTRYDNLFDIPFPYSMGFHQAPFDGQAHPEWALHAHFYPPLLRSATVRKFMVGYELMAMPQRDITPEAAADRLRAVGEIHYKRAEGAA
jgi:UDPglucose--hexose-1-phosphate uridylyltransferase